MRKLAAALITLFSLLLVISTASSQALSCASLQDGTVTYPMAIAGTLTNVAGQPVPSDTGVTFSTNTQPVVRDNTGATTFFTDPDGNGFIDVVICAAAADHTLTPTIGSATLTPISLATFVPNAINSMFADDSQKLGGVDASQYVTSAQVAAGAVAAGDASKLQGFIWTDFFDATNTQDPATYKARSALNADNADELNGITWGDFFEDEGFGVLNKLKDSIIVNADELGGLTSGQFWKKTDTLPAATEADPTIPSRSYIGSIPIVVDHTRQNVDDPDQFYEITGPRGLDLRGALNNYQNSYTVPSGKTMQARVCATFTDDGSGSGVNVYYRIGKHDSSSTTATASGDSIVTGSAFSISTTWSTGLLYKHGCSGWFTATNLDVCTNSWSSTCQLQVAMNVAGNDDTDVRTYFAEIELSIA